MACRAALALSLGVAALGYRVQPGQEHLEGSAGAGAAQVRARTAPYAARFGANFSLPLATAQIKRQMCKWYFQPRAHPSSVDCKAWVDRHVVVQDGPLVTARAGDPGKPWVVFIHGWPDTAGLWVNQFMRLSPEFYCVAVQLPNYLDALPTEELYLDEVTARIAEVFQDQGKVPLVGHDWGANFGYMVSYKFPEQVQKYAALDIGNDVAMWDDAKEVNRNQTWMSYFINKYQNALGDAYLNPIRGRATAYIMSRGTPSNHATPRMGMYYDRAWKRDEYCLRMAPDVKPADWKSLWTPLAGTGIPQPGMLYIQGSTLATTKKFTDAVVADGGKVVELQSAGHWIPKDGAAETNRLLAEWLGERVPPKTPSYDDLSYTACGAGILKSVYEYGYAVTGEKKWDGRRFYGKCAGTDGPSGKISCIPSECAGVDWCFVQAKCGGWFNACTRQVPPTCPSSSSSGP